jgi:nucleoside-diphosphate-sugar epimerase
MIIGSGLLARSFAAEFSKRSDVLIYAAGVSNSGCKDPGEFARERLRRTNALAQTKPEVTFVDFGTCSAVDPQTRHSPYVQHKIAMEQLSFSHPRHLIIRLPQIAGKSPNPHARLNYLYARISRSESFELWLKAKRNIIDVDDVVTIASHLLADTTL